MASSLTNVPFSFTSPTMLRCSWLPSQTRVPNSARILTAVRLSAMICVFFSKSLPIMHWSK